MRRATCVFILSLLASTAVSAAKIDMNDPRRTVGMEDDVRVDAQLTSEFVSAQSLIGVTYQIQNLSPRAIAIADRAAEASFDSDSSTVTLSIGAEVPPAGEMPRIVVIHSGEKRTFSAGAVVRWSLRGQRIGRPAYVQIRVNVLRDAAPFAAMSERRKLSDEQFEQWLKFNVSIVLNTVPVRYRVENDTRSADASRR